VELQCRLGNCSTGPLPLANASSAGERSRILQFLNLRISVEQRVLMHVRPIILVCYVAQNESRGDFIIVAVSIFKNPREQPFLGKVTQDQTSPVEEANVIDI